MLNRYKLYAKEGWFFSQEEFLAQELRIYWSKDLETKFKNGEEPFTNYDYNYPVEMSRYNYSPAMMMEPPEITQEEYNLIVGKIVWLRGLTGNTYEDNKYVALNPPWFDERSYIPIPRSKKYPDGGCVIKDTHKGYCCQHHRYQTKKTNYVKIVFVFLFKSIQLFWFFFNTIILQLLVVVLLLFLINYF